MGFFGNKAINRIYLHSAFYGLSDNVGFVFVYAYLLKAGLGVPIILCTIAALLLCRFAFRPSVIPVVKRIGIRNGLILGTGFDAAGYVILTFVHGLGPLYFAYVIFGAFGNAYYWTCYHAFVARVGDEDARGRQVSLVQAFSAIAGILGPLLASALISTWGSAASFPMAAVICAAGILPLLGTPNQHIAKQAVISPAAIKLATRSFFADGLMAGCTVFVWFIALFEALGENFSSYGAALALAGLAGAGMALGVGRLFDLGHQKRSFQIAYAMMAVMVLAKAFGSGNALGAVAANAFAALAGPLYLSAVNSRIYNAAKQSACTLRFHVYSEGAWDIGAASGCLVAALLAAQGFSFFWPILLGLVGCAIGYVTLQASIGPSDA
jgi:MFS family permease